VKLPKHKKNNSTFEIKILTKEETLSIQNIWRECFTPDIQYINNFIEICFPYSISWGLFLNNSKDAIAMLSLLPSYVLFKNNSGGSKRINGAYLYGVGTLKEHRGNKYSSILVNEVISYSKKNSLDYILVKPAEDSLFDLYQKQTFDNLLYCYKVEVELNKTFNLDSNFNKLNSYTSHLKLRESIAATNFLWPNEILRYSLMEIESRNGTTRYLDNWHEAPLFYSAYPSEDETQIVKIIDHNINSPKGLESVINDISLSFPSSAKALIEFPITTNMDLFNEYSNKPLITKNALIKTLTPEREIVQALLEMHLTLSME